MSENRVFWDKPSEEYAEIKPFAMDIDAGKPITIKGREYEPDGFKALFYDNGILGSGFFRKFNPETYRDTMIADGEEIENAKKKLKMRAQFLATEKQFVVLKNLKIEIDPEPEEVNETIRVIYRATAKLDLYSTNDVNKTAAIDTD